MSLINTLNKLSVFTKVIFVVAMVAILFIAKTGTVSAAICAHRFIAFGEQLPLNWFTSEEQCKESSSIGNKCSVDQECDGGSNGQKCINHTCVLPKDDGGLSSCVASDGSVLSSGECTDKGYLCTDGSLSPNSTCKGYTGDNEKSCVASDGTVISPGNCTNKGYMCTDGKLEINENCKSYSGGAAGCTVGSVTYPSGVCVNAGGYADTRCENGSLVDGNGKCSTTAEGDSCASNGLCKPGFECQSIPDGRKICVVSSGSGDSCASNGLCKPGFKCQSIPDGRKICVEDSGSGNGGGPGTGGGGTGGGTVPSPSPSAAPDPDNGQCANGAGAVNACATFNCPNGDTTGDNQCNVDDDGATFSGWQSGSGCSLPACGQTDYYTEEGNWDSYCGHVFTGNFPDCGGGGGGGGGGRSPRPSSPAGPQCVSISSDKASPKVGESVTFTCGEVSQIKSYKFRVVLPNGDFFSLKSTGRVSEPFQVNIPGKFSAQCTVCQGNNGKNCTAFEKVAK